MRIHDHIAVAPLGQTVYNSDPAPITQKRHTKLVQIELYADPETVEIADRDAAHPTTHTHTHTSQHQARLPCLCASLGHIASQEGVKCA
jgi:hypothetical protein